MLVLLTVWRWGSGEVRGNAFYLSMVVLLASVWWHVPRQAAGFLGIRFREDVIERRHPASALVLSAALLATTIIYAGANIGEADSIFTPLVPAVAATAVLLLLWLLIELLTSVSDAVNLDNDVTSALRLAGFLLGSGLMLAHAVTLAHISADERAVPVLRQNLTAALDADRRASAIALLLNRRRGCARR